MPTQENVLPAESAFVTVAQAQAAINRLLAEAPCGGTLWGITTRSSSLMLLSTSEDQAATSWRVGVVITLPRWDNMICGKLAGWGLWGSEREVAFVLKADADAVTVGPAEGGPRHKAHSYVLLNGSFQSNHHLSTEMKQARPFRDREARNLYGTTFDTTEWQRILDVIKSELQASPAFPDLK